MLDLSVPSEQEALNKVYDFILGLHEGLCFCLVMRDPDTGKLTYHERTQLPCIGGELRKYRSTHGAECTQPRDSRPSDLQWPFPEGIPEVVAFPWTNFGFDIRHLDPTHKFIMELFSPSSPWSRGVGAGWSHLFNKDGKYAGFILQDTEFDPTVLVSLLKFMQHVLPYRATSFFELLEGGLTKQEALANCVMTDPQIPGYLYAPDTYSSCTFFDLERIMKGNPHDFTGGSFRNRFDYSRKMMPFIFGTVKEAISGPLVPFAPDNTGLKYHDELMKRGAVNNQFQTTPSLVSVVREIFKERGF